MPGLTCLHQDHHFQFQCKTELKRYQVQILRFFLSNKLPEYQLMETEHIFLLYFKQQRDIQYLFFLFQPH